MNWADAKLDASVDALDVLVKNTRVHRADIAVHGIASFGVLVASYGGVFGTGIGQLLGFIATIGMIVNVFMVMASSARDVSDAMCAMGLDHEETVDVLVHVLTSKEH